MSRLLARSNPSPVIYGLLFLAALAVALGGFEHARLFYRGYDEVDVVGPLFLLNGIASGVVVLFLIFDRVALFVLGSLAISTGSLVSILISHSSSFFGFAEAAYDGAATLTVVSEIAAIVLTVAAVAAGALRAPQEVTA